MRYVLTDVRKSIYQDILDRAEESGVEQMIHLSGLNIIYGKNVIAGLGFRKSSGDQKSKLKSLANYNCVIIEEADEVSEEDFIQLDDSLRTIKGDITVILLLNPPHRNHWIIKRWFKLLQSNIDGYYIPRLKKEAKKDTLFIYSKWQDNKQNITPSTRNNFINYKKNKPDHYYNMICGLVSEGARGRIFKNWTTISEEEFNELPYPSFYGLDFGFTNDPTALIEVKRHRNKVWLRELVYETGLTQKHIKRKFVDFNIKEEAEIFADSQDPRLIRELVDEGYNVIGALKGNDSIRTGVDMLLDLEICYTENSTNIETETQEYKWALDQNKEPTNEPIDAYNHTIDAIRYAVFTKSKQGYSGFL